MYNSEIWSPSKKMETQINQFQRRLLRYMINVKWPQKISTEELHQKLKFEDWNKEISIRRLTWCGHLLRLPPNCPAQIALKLLEEPYTIDKKQQTNMASNNKKTAIKHKYKLGTGETNSIRQNELERHY